MTALEVIAGTLWRARAAEPASPYNESTEAMARSVLADLDRYGFVVSPRESA